MRVVAHRGLNDTCDGPGDNSWMAFERAFKHNLSVEVDVRYSMDRPYLTCTHDEPPLDLKQINTSKRLHFGDFCELLSQYPHALAFVDMKADYIAVEVIRLAREYGVLEQLVTFDYSVPSLLYADAHYPDLVCAWRCSRYETTPPVIPGDIGPRVPWIVLDPIGHPTTEMWLTLKFYYEVERKRRPGVKFLMVSPDVFQSDWELRAFREWVSAWNDVYLLTDKAHFFSEGV